MPLTLPDLDDRRYADLVDEARALIATHAPEWTNHNPSDPGITLIELFAWLSEMLLYRLNRVSDANLRTFLKLLNGRDWKPSGLTPEALAADIRASVQALRRQERAVSCADFETLALAADARVARVRCLVRRNALIDFDTEQPGHISLIVVPRDESELAPVIRAVAAYLEPRRLLTTFVHVLGAQSVAVDIDAEVVALPDVEPSGLMPRVSAALRGFLDPLHGGEQQFGWPFGRDVFVSEIYQLLDQFPGVDYVTRVELSSDDPARVFHNAHQQAVGLSIKPHELVRTRTTTLVVAVA